MLLASVKYLDIDLRCIRCPCDVGKIMVVSEFISLNICDRAACDVVYTQLYVLRIHSRHRILDLHEGTCAGGDVKEREGCYL